MLFCKSLDRSCEAGDLVVECLHICQDLVDLCVQLPNLFSHLGNRFQNRCVVGPAPTEERRDFFRHSRNGAETHCKAVRHHRGEYTRADRTGDVAITIAFFVD